MSAAAGEPVTVVLIDDHAMFRQALCRLLSAEPRVRVVGVAEGGEEGIACARQHHPAVVVTDLRMPGMRGVEVTRTLDEVLPDVGVLTLTVTFRVGTDPTGTIGLSGASQGPSLTWSSHSRSPRSAMTCRGSAPPSVAQ